MDISHYGLEKQLLFYIKWNQLFEQQEHVTAKRLAPFVQLRKTSRFTQNQSLEKQNI